MYPLKTKTAQGTFQINKAGTEKVFISPQVSLFSCGKTDVAEDQLQLS